MKKAIMCTVQTRTQADAIVAQLQNAGFSEISVLFSNHKATEEFAVEYNTKAPEGAVAGVGAGGVIGGSLGLLAGIGALAIPGIGPLIAAGPILAALSGAAAGATIGGLAGALVGAGVPEIEAKHYEGKLHHGSILISVHTESGDEAKLAEQLFRVAQAEDISTNSEAEAARLGM